MSVVNYILDEAAVLGHLESIDSAIGIGRGYGIRLNLYYQSIGQLTQCFPEGQHVTVLSNCTQIFFAVNDNQTADFISNRLGEQTIVLHSGGTNTGSSSQYSQGCSPSDSYGSSSSSDSKWNLQARKLLKPDEVIGLPPRMAITFTPGTPPICSWLLRHYEEKDLYAAANTGQKVRSKQSILKSSLLCVSLFGAAAILTNILIQQQTPDNYSQPAINPESRQITNTRSPYDDRKQ